jgi:hypothetical protein
MKRSTTTAICEELASAAVERFNEVHDMPPSVTLISIESEQEGTYELNALDPGWVNALHQDEHGKDLLMAFIRVSLTPLGGEMLCHMGITARSPDVIVHISQASTLKVHVSGDQNLADDLMSAIDGHARLEDHPEHSKAIVCTVHTREGSVGAICPITGDGAERRATLGPIGSLISTRTKSKEGVDNDHTVH